MTMVTARNCTETRFNQLWDALHEKSSAENESLFQQELHRCRSKRQRSKLAGRFAGARKPYSMPSVKVGSSAHFWTRLSTREYQRMAG